MTTVNSLVCWGGLTGKAVTLTIANPCVASSTGHGVRDGLAMVFSTSGALPTGVVAGTTYYAKKVDVDTFNLYDTKAHAIAGGATGRVATSGSQSGTHTAKSDLIVNPSIRLAAYGLSDLTRWGTSGSERIYDGIRSWNAARVGALATDEEVCELGEGFIERDAFIGNYSNYKTEIKVPAAKLTITSHLNGKRSEGFHGGRFDQGFAFITAYYGFDLQTYDSDLNGFTFLGDSNAPVGLGNMAAGCSAINMVFYSTDRTDSAIKLKANNTIKNCLISGWGNGIFIYNDTNHMVVANNLVTKCNKGIVGYGGYESSIKGRYFNNVCIGNLVNNWGTAVAFDGAAGNFGLSGEAWGAVKGVLATTDLVSYGTSTVALTDDFRPAAASSPQVETAVSYYGEIFYDIADALRPNYNNGTPAYSDVGCFEFDHGYGLPPATCTLTLTNVVVGSRINIRDQAGTTTHYDALAASSTVVVPITVYGSSLDNWRIRVRKASGSPNYIPYETLMTAIAGATSIYVSQIPDE